MSGFKRTSSGLDNQKLFYGVDLVIYLEGGPKSYSKQEVDGGAFNVETVDELFWRRIFDTFLKERKVKFKSVGSKNTVKDIAVDIVNGKVKVVAVAMDCEFDGVLTSKMEHNNILYTYGYSWENDCWTVDVVKSIIEELTAVAIVNNDVERNFDLFLKRIRIAVIADAYLFNKMSSFFPRASGHLFCVDCSPADLPSILIGRLNDRLAAKALKKSTLYSFARRNGIKTDRHMYGHFLFDYCCQLIIHYLKNRCHLTGMKKEFISRMGIKKYFDLGFADGPAFEYYQSLLAKV